MTHSTDVIVVGAGVAGMAAAAALRTAGASCLMLEATGRVGGRAWTEQPDAIGGAAFDHGASWLHAAGRNPLVGVARAYRDPLRSTATRTRRMIIDGRIATTEELAELKASQDSFIRFAEARAADGPDVSFADAVAPLADDPWTATISRWEANQIAAADPADFSLRDWQLNQLDGDNMSVDGGIGAFVARRMKPVAGPVQLDTPVSRIAWGDGVAVDTPGGRLQARAVIVTVSTGVLAAGHIRFDPVLPDEILAAIDGLPMGLLSKVALQLFGAQFLGLQADCSIQRRARAGEPAMSFHVRPGGADHAVGFVGGPDAWALAQAGEAAAVDFARTQWQRDLGAKAAASLGAAVATSWGTDRHFLGAYAYARPGHLEARRVLGEPVGDGQLMFAGEAVRMDGLAGTVAGAWISGKEAAAAVIARFGLGRIAENEADAAG